MSVTLEDVLSEAESSFVTRLPGSRAQYENALKYMPGGNTRSVLYTGPFPVFMKKGKDNYLWDYDGNEYIDFVGELTAGLYGHSNPILQETILSTYQNIGVNLGATTGEEVRFAELICRRFPNVEQLRFCNSGTEANIYALSIARYMTGKRKVIAFEGCYHGGVLGFAHGIGKNNVDPNDWVVAKYNDVEGIKTLIKDTPGVAAVILEAMQGAGGCIPATPEFLRAVQDTAAENDVLFILDEVMTSRLHPHGLQGLHSLKPDLTTLGKYLGGGLAFGAFGGRASLLSSYDPRLNTSLPHSGTFNNNSLAMNCGYVGLSRIYTPERAVELNALGDYFRTQLQEISRGTKMVVTGVGAAVTVHFIDNGVVPNCGADVDEHSVAGLKKLFWFWCLSNRFWITERGMMSLILGTTKDELDSFVSMTKRFLTQYASLICIAS